MLMSFSQQVKSELLKIEYESTCCEKAMLYGMCIFGKTFSSYGVGIQLKIKKSQSDIQNLLKSIAILNAKLKHHRLVKVIPL